jgi:hypothetical protein
MFNSDISEWDASRVIFTSRFLNLSISIVTVRIFNLTYLLRLYYFLSV